MYPPPCGSRVLLLCKGCGLAPTGSFVCLGLVAETEASGCTHRGQVRVRHKHGGGRMKKVGNTWETSRHPSFSRFNHSTCVSVPSHVAINPGGRFARPVWAQDRQPTLVRGETSAGVLLLVGRGARIDRLLLSFLHCSVSCQLSTVRGDYSTLKYRSQNSTQSVGEKAYLRNWRPNVRIPAGGGTV